VDLKQSIKNLPATAGIYQFFDAGGNLLYVGKALSLKKRVASYFQNKNLGPKTNLLVKKIARIRYIKVFSEFEALLLEAELIKANQPFFNFQAKDDKSPLYIKISNEDIPIVTITRKEKPRRGVFIKGPFTSAKSTREVLNLIRKVFPYCHHKNAKKPCLFVHLGLCPYPYASLGAKKNYLKNIKTIKKLLSGESRALSRDLTKEMVDFAKSQQFEEANKLKKQIQNLEYITTAYHQPAEFLQTPTLVDDLILSKLKNLQQVLGLEKLPKRIECYDISNISGQFATGSMVVFEKGQPAKDQYRRFKIKFTRTPNDYQMLEEVLTRRFKNNWPVADLVIVDGGRGQLNSAKKVIEKFKVSTKIISLAKRFEDIYTQDNLGPISLPKESAARQLVEALRDEAHRFAIAYHRLLRSKQLIAS